MGECLREVADLLPAGDVVLLGVQAEVVVQGEQPLKQLPRLGVAAVERERLDQPERAGQGLALAARPGRSPRTSLARPINPQRGV
jgi:hypothetical protein